MPTSEPACLPLNASANACDDAAAAACDNAEAVKFVDVDAASNGAVADRTTTSCEGVIWDSGIGVDVPRGELGAGVSVEIAEYGFADVQDFGHFLFENRGKRILHLPASRASTERPRHEGRMTYVIT